METEIWKDVVGAEGLYIVSNFGNVRRVRHEKITKLGNIRVFKEKEIKQNIHKGYMLVALQIKGVTPLVHRLVAMAFIPNPENKKTVNHIDADKTNNHISNLEWSTHTEQMQHAVANNLLEVRGAPKFTKEYKKEIYEYAKSNDVTIIELSRIFGVSERTAGRIVNEGVHPRPTTRILKTGERIVEDILTKKQVAEIKELRRQGMTYKAIGEIYNRGISQIFRVVKDQTRTTEIE